MGTNNAMKEKKWVRCPHPQPMLEFLEGKVSLRKLRLIAVACCRRIWPILQETDIQTAVEWSEESADRKISPRAYKEISDFAKEVCGEACVNAALNEEMGVVDEAMARRLAAVIAGSQASQQTLEHSDVVAIMDSAVRASIENRILEEAAQADLLRDIIGSPFRLISLASDCRTPIVASLARATYEERNLPSGELDLDRLSILADALEDAGCTAAAILDHLRGPGPHVRGCFALDLILEKE